MTNQILFINLVLGETRGERERETKARRETESGYEIWVIPKGFGQKTRDRVHAGLLGRERKKKTHTHTEKCKLI